MKFGLYVGERVTFEVDGERVAGRVAELGYRFVRFVADTGEAFRVKVLGPDVVVVTPERRNRAGFDCCYD